ncbi:hypothetical protein M409DRAFT_59736 [Zasmidium cellare ATCC 36951]|uniref:Wax synthase domain-containing protein n=1 Tax=Zasmidium cellare ATCC 36951 TaxID=1080233 RepID=A0A6A6C0Z4_ZASCE|nr:uncharacterized protein M409DRAFT_59736 [Zasmidium cellare ATCC 36951]KAF2160704.1 hypothetical protein M409DRAFT_59736 [Zasmidium cellare ATCC 36951]
MLPPGLKTAREVKRHYDQVYEQHMVSGQYYPFLYPWATVGFAVVLIYLLIDHRRSPTLRSLRNPLFGFLCAFSAWCILTNKARSSAAAYGVGLVSAWGTLWTGAIMFFHDCQTDFKRIERADNIALKKISGDGHDGHPNGSLSNGSIHKPTEVSTKKDERLLSKADRVATQGSWQRTGPLFWQEYPTAPFIERLDWILDAFCAFRGTGWTFETHGIAPLPPSVTAELSGTPTKNPDPTIMTSRSGIRRFTNRTALLKDCLTRLTIGFFILDLIKTLMHHDAYFWGYMDASAPQWFPSTSPILLKSYRLLLSLFGIHCALLQIFHLGPIFFTTLPLGVRSEPWMNPPDFYGNYSAVWNKGLAGWWGSWWHQTFRYAFEAPATRLLEALNIDKRSQKGKLISLFVAFGLSGTLHACGSYTQLGDTRPLMGPFRFFILQAVGIVLQMQVTQTLRRAGITDKIPQPIQKLGNFLFVNIWMYFTAPLLVDDFAKGGVWLYEPLAISPLRLLGFGAPDDNGYDLWYGLIFWRLGKHWWDTGIAF